VLPVIASIPSPSFNAIGPFNIYGLMIALGAFAAIWLGQRRWAAQGGNPDDIGTIALFGIPAGVIGARLYHVLTDWNSKFSGEPLTEIFNIRAGGLGIPGGMFLGVVVGLLVAKARGMELNGVLDAVVPGLPLAQAIGRWGNWFNQEVYGRPTSLPWGLEIDAEHRFAIPEEFRDVDAYPTFHPTFLYEAIWNVGLTALLLWIDRKGWLPRGRLISVYMIGYGVGRLWLETVRIDAATEVAGLRVNIWMSLALIVGGLVVLFWPGRTGASEAEQEERDTVTS